MLHGFAYEPPVPIEKSRAVNIPYQTSWETQRATIDEYCVLFCLLNTQNTCAQFVLSYSDKLHYHMNNVAQRGC